MWSTTSPQSPRSCPGAATWLLLLAVAATGCPCPDSPPPLSLDTPEHLTLAVGATAALEVTGVQFPRCGPGEELRTPASLSDVGSSLPATAGVDDVQASSFLVRAADAGTAEVRYQAHFPEEAPLPGLVGIQVLAPRSARLEPAGCALLAGHEAMLALSMFPDGGPPALIVGGLEAPLALGPDSGLRLLAPARAPQFVLEPTGEGTSRRGSVTRIPLQVAVEAGAAQVRVRTTLEARDLTLEVVPVSAVRRVALGRGLPYSMGPGAQQRWRLNLRASGQDVCAPPLAAFQLRTETPDVCTVEPEQDVDGAYARVRAQAKGLCRVGVAVPGANGGAGLEALFELTVS